MPIEPGLTQDGRLPSPPPFEQRIEEIQIDQDVATLGYATVKDEKNYTTILDSEGSVLVGDQQHRQLWDSFFQNYFPEANADWVGKLDYNAKIFAPFESYGSYLEEELGFASGELTGDDVGFIDALESRIKTTIDKESGKTIAPDEVKEKILKFRISELEAPVSLLASALLKKIHGREGYTGEIRTATISGIHLLPDDESALASKYEDSPQELADIRAQIQELNEVNSPALQASLSELSYSTLTPEDLHRYLGTFTRDAVNANHLERVQTISFYKNTFDSYLKIFGTYLNSDEGADDKAVFKGEKDLDADGNTITPSSQSPVTDTKLIENRVSVWKSYLSKKTDILFRSKAMYLWVMLDLLEMMNTLTKTILNSQGTQRVLNVAQKKITEALKQQELIKIDKIQFFYNPPTNRLVVPQAFAGLTNLPDHLAHAITHVDNIPEDQIYVDAPSAAIFTGAAINAAIGAPYGTPIAFAAFGAAAVAASLPAPIPGAAKLIPFPDIIPFPIGVPYPSIMQHNGVVKSKIGVLKALRGRITQKGEEENVNTESAYKALQKHNQYITELLGQLNTLLSQVTA
ncbi:MAG: hypothetical protein ACI9S8_002279 [Chlamydiales bacterium]|jgi:hypothetical protein